MNKIQMVGSNGSAQQTGAVCEVVMYGNNLDRFKGRTLYVVIEGPEFTEGLSVEGRLPGTLDGEPIWVDALADYFDASATPRNAVELTSGSPGAYHVVLGADYEAIRVSGGGGTDPVEADPEGDPPVEAVIGSSLSAGLIA